LHMPLIDLFLKNVSLFNIQFRYLDIENWVEIISKKKWFLMIL